MKRQNGNYFQMSHSVNYKDLSASAVKLFVQLKSLENKFTTESKKEFFRSNKDLADDTGLSESTVERSKKELTGAKLIKTKRGKLNDNNFVTITIYEILE